MFDGSILISMSQYYSLNLNLPLHLIGVGGTVNNHRSSHPKSRPSNSFLSSSSSSKHSSVLLQSDERRQGNLVESSTSSSGSRSTTGLAANTIGVIGGGLSPFSTLGFLEKLVAWSSKDGEEGLPFIVCSEPALSKLLSIGEGSSPGLPRQNPANYKPQYDSTRIVEILRSKRLFLERSGARCIVMPCHISHSWFEEVADGCSVPFLHIAESVATELKDAKLRPIATGSRLSIGVLATSAILSAGFYQEKLQNQGFEVVLPDKATMEHTVIPASEAYNRKDMEGARNLLRIALQVLLVRGVNTVILASDDMHGLLPRDDPLLKKFMDPMDSLVMSTIRWAKSTEFKTEW